MAANRSICLITNDNGWGLTKDYLLLQKLLKQAGYEVSFQQWDERSNLRGKKHLINIHLELVGNFHFRDARHNWLIPNQEWFMPEWKNRWRRFNKVLCKTQLAKRIFTDIGFRNVKYIGFDTLDIYNSNIIKKFEFCHISGNSRFKGTNAVVEVWRRNPNFPKLHLFNAWEDLNIDLPNVEYTFGYVDSEEIRKTQNQCMFHIQPSLAEGYGHVIWEALSCGGIVIGTDGPPMNEVPTMIKTPAIKGDRHHYGLLYNVSINKLEENVRKLINMTKEEIVEKSKLSRKAYLTASLNFKKRLFEEIKDDT